MVVFICCLVLWGLYLAVYFNSPQLAGHLPGVATRRHVFVGMWRAALVTRKTWAQVGSDPLQVPCSICVCVCARVDQRFYSSMPGRPQVAGLDGKGRRCAGRRAAGGAAGRCRTWLPKLHEPGFRESS
jgi:hypothetical protein